MERVTVDSLGRLYTVVSMNCLYAVIVGEWEESLEYSFTLLDTDGRVIEETKHKVQPNYAST